MTRTKAREQAFILLFERAFREDSMEEILRDASQSREWEPNRYAKTLAMGADAEITALDQEIQGLSVKWKLNRISKVALSVLRMAIWEIQNMENTPVGTSINEAVELAKKYGSEDDYAYVNGVLGAYVRKEKT